MNFKNQIVFEDQIILKKIQKVTFKNFWANGTDRSLDGFRLLKL